MMTEENLSRFLKTACSSLGPTLSAASMAELLTLEQGSARRNKAQLRDILLSEQYVGLYTRNSIALRIDVLAVKLVSRPDVK